MLMGVLLLMVDFKRVFGVLVMNRNIGDYVIFPQLKKGDKIITMGGIYGTVQGFKEKGRQAIIKIDNNTNITINKTAIAGLAEKIKDTELEQS